MEQRIYEEYLGVLEEELVPAMGCTEPIAIAYAGALARETLGEVPKQAKVQVSANIIKNVKSVVVPHTGGRRGIAAAVAAGIVAGNAGAELEVLSGVTEEQMEEMGHFLQVVPIDIAQSVKPYVFHIVVSLTGESHTATAEIAGQHTNVIRVERDGQMLRSQEYQEANSEKSNRELLNVKDIVAFADQVKIEDIRGVLQRQIDYNMAIAREGLRGNWGANIGSVLLDAYGAGIHNRAKAYAAAGSDARMNGCELPVVINSGSGNQGLTTSLPVVLYGEELGVSQEQLYRALVVSNLVTIHLKTGIGRLSAYCGATSAGCGAGAGICYLHGGREDAIAHTIVNAIAINSGMVCDGAKASCAAKIASAVEAGLLGFQMQRHGTEFYGGDGIITKGVENSIHNVGRMARLGMAQTDQEIIRIMLENH